MQFNFRTVINEDRECVYGWLHQPYISRWFYGEGLANTLKGIEEHIAGGSFSKYWLGLDGERPVAFLITSLVEKPDDELMVWCQSSEKTITLDMLIGDPEYLGKGLAVPLIQQFLKSQFPDAAEVLIDPEATNEKAIHVYQKAGFKIVGEFVPQHSPHLHYMMRLACK